MSANEQFEKLEELARLSDPDNSHFEFTMEERDKLWDEVTKDMRDSFSHFLIMYTNILVDKGLIDRDLRDVAADRILTNLFRCVMDDYNKTFEKGE